MHANPKSTPTEKVETLHDLTPDEREMQQLHSVYVEAGMNKKYFAKRLHAAQCWNRWLDIGLVATTVLILILSTRAYNQISAAGYSIGIAFVSGVALFISMTRHYFKTTKNIEQFSKLYQEYTSLFYRLRDLEDELWIKEKLTDCMRKELTKCKERITNIATDEDLVPTRSELEIFQEETQQEIGLYEQRLFLPGRQNDANQRPTPTETEQARTNEEG